MGGRPPSTKKDCEAAQEQLDSARGLDETWKTWSKTEVVCCVADGAPIALCVDAPMSSYRFVCVECGNASSWFEVSNGEVRAQASTITDGSLRPRSPRV
jgi:hypothetical protein